jgi:hypothetical protein
MESAEIHRIPMKRLPVRLFPSFCLLAGAVFPAQAQLTLNQIGGPLGAGNYGTLAGTSAFAFDVLPAAPTHTIPHANDGIFGNPNSWIGNSNNSFVGLNFGATALPLGQVAWGRDNLNQFFDRTSGLYTLNYTQVPNPGAALAVTGNPATGWAPIGSTNYVFQGAANSPISMSLRHVWSFPTVNATGIRLTAPGSSFANGAAIDELEAYAPGPAPLLSLVTTGGTMGAGNIGLTSTAFAKDLLGNGSFAPTHTIPNLNDGVYGNGNSWIGDTESSFAGLNFNGSFTVNQAAFGRDNTGAFGDRSGGTYLLQYTTAANPGAATPDASWNTIGAIYYDHNGVDSADRHLYSFPPVTATGMRLVAPGNGIGTGAAIDEFEVYAVPETSAAGLLLLAGAGLCRRRRK